MTKTIKTLAVAALACVTICGTTMAAPPPKGGRGPAPAHQKAPAPKRTAPRGHTPPAHRPAPARPVVHRAPPPPPPPPRRHVVHVEHHEDVGIAALVGGIFGGLIAAIAN